MRYVYIFTALCALAIGPALAGEGVEVGSDPNQVAEQFVYDLGIQGDEAEPESVEVETPEGKADKLVVISASWCTPCRALKPVLAALKKDGYDIEVYDADFDLDKVAERYSNIKRNPDPTKVNEWHAVPTIFYLRGDMIIKRETGYKTSLHIRDTLWKSDADPSKLEQLRRRFPWNR